MKVAGTNFAVHTVKSYRGSSNSNSYVSVIVQVLVRCHSRCQRAACSVGWTCNIQRSSSYRAV